jgi:hypothetical protein
MMNYETRMALDNSDSDSDYLEMKKYVRPKPNAATGNKKKTGTTKTAAKATPKKKRPSGLSPNKRKRASTAHVKEEPDLTQSEDFGLSQIFATPSYSQDHTYTPQLSYACYDNPATCTSLSQNVFAEGQGVEPAWNGPIFPYNSAFGNDYFSYKANLPGALHSYTGEAGPSSFDAGHDSHDGHDGHGGVDGENEQVINTVSAFDDDSSRYEGSDSEEERPRKAAKLNKDGVPRKPRRPRPKLLKWSDDDWKNVILGIVWACGENGIQIPFEQAAKVVGEHCTAGALQQALLKLRGKQIAEGYQIPSLKMAWTRKNRYATPPSSSANSKSAQDLDDDKTVSLRKEPACVEVTQSKVIALKRSYNESDRKGISFPYQWKKPLHRQSNAYSEPTDTKQGGEGNQPSSASDIQDVNGVELSITQAPDPSSSYVHPILTQPRSRTIRVRRQQNHRNGKVSSGSGELTLNPAGSVDAQAATFHSYPDSDEIFKMDPFDDVPAVVPGGLSSLQYSEETLGMLEGRVPAAGVSELRTDFAFPPHPNNYSQNVPSFSGMPVGPKVPDRRSSAPRRQGHCRSAAILPGDFFNAGTNASTPNLEEKEEIKYSDIVANTVVYHTPNTPNRYAQVYSPRDLGYPCQLEYPTPWYLLPPLPSTPENTVAANESVSATISSVRSNSAFNPQGNHTIDVNGNMTMAHASYENLLTTGDNEGLSNGFADLADDIFG